MPLLSEQTGFADLSSSLPGVPAAACTACVSIWEQGLCSVIFALFLPAHASELWIDVSFPCILINLSSLRADLSPRTVMFIDTTDV